jgi:hypothetical protein
VHSRVFFHPVPLQWTQMSRRKSSAAVLAAWAQPAGSPARWTRMMIPATSSETVLAVWTQALSGESSFVFVPGSRIHDPGSGIPAGWGWG